MSKVQKIMCCCVAGLGSSMILSMNVEAALKDIGLSDIEVDHTRVSDVYKGAADLYVCSTDVEDELEQFGPIVPIVHLANKKEITETLKKYFEEHKDLI